ncbi:bifunctional 5,10-methylenetetrahydrofolate dehydrogenase/5,10-methenyltetrahydrofolate cyclohydrolase [Candidatus Saccharibacteria bacterium]|nr:bifunctional 5,10-methylenetetrahydrofolate dehydrogenase/5,10-methenyltetrahydrofolate cyclohydrolase [Candidatus Saccharibacteria bacterium]
MTKELNGQELAGFVKERQAHVVRAMKSRKVFPKLVIIRDSDNPVITKYVNLKIHYGNDIGVDVEDCKVTNIEEAKEAVRKANDDSSVSGIIVQLPLADTAHTDEVVNLIVPKKDVDGLSQMYSNNTSSAEYANHGKLLPKRIFESATATAINWLLAGHDIDLSDKKIALVGRGRLVGAPLARMWQISGYDVTVFHHNSDLSKLRDYDVVVSATGVPHLITNDMIKPGAVIVDAGTASEDGVLVGDVDDSVRNRTDLKAITPVRGGVGPLTVAVLFEDVIQAAEL